MYCPKCGTEQKAESKFCQKCGYNIANHSENNRSFNYGGVNDGANEHIINDKKQSSQVRNKRILCGSLILSSIVIAIFLFLYKDNIKDYFFASKPAISNKDNKEEKLKKEQPKEGQSKEEQLKEAININLNTLEQEDLKGYMATLIIPSDQTSQTKETYKKIFEDYDLKYTIENIKVLTTDNEDAQVEVVQLTKKLQGIDFADNRITAIHHLKQNNGQWKIFHTDLKNIEYIKENTVVNTTLITKEKALAIMQNIIPVGNFEYDHDDSKDGAQYYVIRQIGSGAGTIPTVGWFYVDKKDGTAFEWNLAENTLMPVSINNNMSYGTQSEYIFSFSDTRVISDSEINNLHPALLTYARNEIFARHGYVFSNPELKNYFESKLWYKANPSFKGDTEGLNLIEKENLKIIQQRE
jgi:hypothetical protein